MTRHDPVGLVAAVLLAAVLGAPSAAAQAPAKGDTCVTAYEEAQELRRQNRLVRARAELLLCQRACPTTLTRDCDRWLSEVDAVIPTVVLSARDPRGAVVDDVRVRVDGAPLVEHLQGAPVPVDPGSHRFVFERHGGGAPVEVRATIAAGARDQQIAATFPDATVSEDISRTPPTISWVLGGVALTGLAIGAALGINGHLDRVALEDECSPNCTDEDVDPIRVQWWIGGISAGVGAAAGIAAAWIWLAAEPRVGAERRGSGVRVVAAPTTSGAVGMMVGRF